MGWEGFGILIACALVYWFALGGNKATIVMNEIVDFIAFLLKPITGPVKWMNERAAANQSPFLRPIFWLWSAAGMLLIYLLIAAVFVFFIYAKFVEPFWQFTY